MAEATEPAANGHYARVLLLAIIGVVLSFLLATSFSQCRGRNIGRRVDQIVGNAMPSVQYLAAARSDLHALDAYVMTLAGRSGSIEEITLEPMQRDRAAVQRDFENYLSFPSFPTESERAASARRQLDRLDEALAQVRGAFEQRSPDALRDAVRSAHTQVVAMDESLRWLVDYNSTQGQRLGVEIRQARSASVQLLVVLDALSVGLAVLAVLLVLHTLRQTIGRLEQRGRSADARAQRFEHRAGELERFAGRMAHDVLSPLMGVGLTMDLVRMRTNADDDANRMLSRGLRSLQQVRHIVDGLLEFAKAGAPSERDARAPIVETLADVVEGARPLADEFQVEVTLGLETQGEVACSAGVLASIVGNLVQNAVKHMGDARSRHVTVRALDVAERVRIEVEDTGPGVPTDLAERIFEPYVRLGETTSLPGIGLGLATVKRLVEAHGGSVGVSPVRSGGSIFWVELPRPPDPLRHEPAANDLPERMGA